jgi:hypothetical protein
MHFEILPDGAGGVYTVIPMSVEIVPGEEIVCYTKNGRRISVDPTKIEPDVPYRRIVRLESGDEIIRIASVAKFL